MSIKEIVQETRKNKDLMKKARQMALDMALAIVLFVTWELFQITLGVAGLGLLVPLPSGVWATSAGVYGSLILGRFLLRQIKVSAKGKVRGPTSAPREALALGLAPATARATPGRGGLDPKVLEAMLVQAAKSAAKSRDASKPKAASAESEEDYPGGQYL